MAAHVKSFLVSGEDRKTGETKHIKPMITAPDRAAAEKYVGDKYGLVNCVAWDVSNGH